MRVADLIAAMESIAPPTLAEEWDNVGLIAGDRQAELRGSVLLTIDLTTAVVTEAREMGAGAIVAYHPPIFRPVRSLTAEGRIGRCLLDCIRAGIAVYSPHTALDAAAGGVADWLVDQAAGRGGGTDRVALLAAELTEASAAFKIVTFVPEAAHTKVREAMSRAGAGRIGAYDQCSFAIPGRGSFFGTESTNPKVGEKGRLEFVDEVRLEMVCSKSALPGAIAGLRAAHPYEEPAFDVYPLTPKPRADLGPGRALTLGTPSTPEELARRLKQALGVATVTLAAAAPSNAVERVAVCPGSGESLLGAAMKAGAQVFITGEMKHHETLGALDAGISVILAGHTETERGYLPTLAAKLNQISPAFGAQVSLEDRPPLAPV